MELKNERNRCIKQKKGLLQGSVLSSLLYNIYTNNQPLRNERRYLIYEAEERQTYHTAYNQCLIDTIQGAVIQHVTNIPDSILTEDVFAHSTIWYSWSQRSVVVVDLSLLRVAVEGSDNIVSLEKPCQASLPPDQQGRHSLRRQPEVQYPGLVSRKE